MPAPIVAAAAAAAKKLAVDTLTDPEKLAKFVVIILGVIIGIVLIFVGPLYLVTNSPVLLLTDPNNKELTDKQLQLVSLYQEAPMETDSEALRWVESQKTKYSYADDIVTNYNFDLTWHELMAIDAVRLNQDFSKVNKGDIADLADKFLKKEAHTETYEDTVTTTSTAIVTKVDSKGKVTTSSAIVTTTNTVEKTRAVISLDTVPFLDMLDLLNFSDKDKEIAINIYNNIINVDVEGHFNIYDDVDLSNLKEYPSGSAALPYFNQTDIRWGNEKYGLTGTIKTSGCGPTSLAMIVAGLTGRSDINPKVVADWSYANGHRAEGQGSYWSLMTEGGSFYGLNVKPLSRKDPNSILEALSKGQPVIASMGTGHFTKHGHFIVLYGITSDNKILVHDPASVKRSNTAWDIKTIIGESSTNGGINGSPFWTYSLKE